MCSWSTFSIWSHCGTFRCVSSLIWIFCWHLVRLARYSAGHCCYACCTRSSLFDHYFETNIINFLGDIYECITIFMSLNSYTDHYCKWSMIKWNLTDFSLFKVISVKHAFHLTKLIENSKEIMTEYIWLFWKIFINKKKWKRWIVDRFHLLYQTEFRHL